ncbi:hypothetical protein TNCV_1395101 [Trichonephila clavipes]|nr:hypothetical protein TNCV_1395101 [Trichonephila clavipes]
MDTCHYATTAEYATCHLRLYTVEPDYSDAWLDQVGIMLIGDVKCLATNPVSNCVLTIVENVSEDSQGSVLVLLSILQATQAFSQELWSAALFILTARPL